MFLPVEAYVHAQKRLQRIFWYRGGELSGDDDLVGLVTGAITAIYRDAYYWGIENIVGVSVRWGPPLGSRLEIYLAQNPIARFRDLLWKYFPLLPYRLVVTGRFEFASGLPGIGAQIALAENPGGTIGLFLKDGGGNRYALTCAHVLDANPAGQQVVSGTQDIGTLAFRKAFLRGLTNPGAPDPDEPNDVDCALAKLNPGAVANLIPGLGSAVSGMGTANDGETVRIVRRAGLRDATVKSTRLDLWFPYEMGRVYFNDLIMVQGDHGIAPGDSGALAISTACAAVAITIGRSMNARTTDKPPRELGPIGVLCDLTKITGTLKMMVGSDLTLA